RPRLVHVHRRVRAAQVGRDARIAGEEVETLDVGFGVERLHFDALGGHPRHGHVRARGLGPLTHVGPGGVVARRVQRYITEIGDLAHGTFTISSRRASTSCTSTPAYTNSSTPAAAPSTGWPGRPA